MMAWLETGAGLLAFALAAVWIMGHSPGLMVLCWWPADAARRVIRGQVEPPRQVYGTTYEHRAVDEQATEEHS